MSSSGVGKQRRMLSLLRLCDRSSLVMAAMLCSSSATEKLQLDTLNMGIEG